MKRELLIFGATLLFGGAVIVRQNIINKKYFDKIKLKTINGVEIHD